ncbi:MAG: 50S ribosomal protein L10 [Paludibacteraceae bacterium]|nr:50S ribosomal protein L10 [Paludibacteraceae bacterium]
MKKEDKNVIIDQVLASLNDYSHFYIADAAGLTADLTSDIRRACFNKDIKLVVVKNTLLKKALDKKEGDFSQLYGALEGPTALMLSNTGNAPAKLIKEFSKGNKVGKPTLKAAFVEEGFYVGADQLDVLASIKSKNELIGDIITLLQSPMRNIISGLQAKADKEAETND